MEIIHKNYKSDFDAILHLKSCVGDVCKEIGWPGYDWVAKFYTTSHDNVYIASNVGGVLTNCFNDNGNIHVVFNNHGLPSGTLRVEFSAEIPNGIYPDGSQLEVSPQPLDIELVREKYTADEEFALHRKMINAVMSPDTISADDSANKALEEYQAYNVYVQECKQKAKDASLYTQDGPTLE